MQNCPKCEEPLKETEVVEHSGHGVKTLGRQKFCSNMNCDFEGKIENIEKRCQQLNIRRF